ncbi:MAG: PAS domain S-box protein [Kovacikia sp.]
MTKGKAETSNHSSSTNNPETVPLSEGDERFQLAMAASPDGFMILRSVRDAGGTIADFVIDYINPAAARIVNCPPEELCGQRLLQALPNWQTSDSFDRYVTVAETGIPITFETFYDRTDPTGWFHNVVVKLTDGIAVSFSEITPRKQAELAWQHPEQPCRMALQTAKVGSWEQDLGTGVLTGSAQCKANLGLPPEAEFTYETLLAALHPDDRSQVEATIQRCIQEQTDSQVKKRCYHPDGSLHWLIIQAQLVYDTEGTPIRLVGLTLDVTALKQSEIVLGQQFLAGVAIEIRERIQAEAALCQREAELRLITNAVPVLISLVDVEQRYRFTNQKYQEWFGKPATETNGKYLWEVLGAAAYETIRPFVEQVLAGQPVTFEGSVPYQEVGIRDVVVDYVPHFDPQGNVEGFVSLVSDITHRKQIEKTLQRYQLLSEHSRDIVLYMSIDGRILEANRAAVQAYGYDRAELLTLKIADLRALHTLSAMPEQFKQASQQGILYETMHRRKNGSHFPVEVSAQSVEIADGKVVLSIIRDITERKRAESEREQLLVREQAAREAAEAAAQRARFLAEASTTLTSSLDYEYTLTSVAQAVVPILADWCAVDILKDDGNLERLATTHTDSAKVQWGRELHRRYPPDLNAPTGLAQVLRTGQSEYYPVISDDQLVAAARDDEHLKLLREIGFSSVMLVPLNTRGRTVGSISFVAAESGRSYSPDDLALAEELAHRAAIALDNARLYREAQQARQAAERAADRTARLQAVTTALSESLSPVQVAEVIVEQSIAALEADVALMALLREDSTTLEIVRIVGYEISPKEDQKQFSIHSPFPLSEAVRTGQPVWSEPLAERLARYPHLAEIYKQFPFEAWISLPLITEGKAVGGLSLAFKQFKLLDQDDRDFVLALTHQCAQAIVRAQLYEAEQQAKADAEQANRIKDEFLAVLSHELRTPLNPILGWARLLQTRQFDESGTKRALETIERNAKLQTQLIDDLLDVSRILRGKMVLNMGPVSLVSVIDAALETVWLAAEAKGIEILKVVLGDVVFVSGDASRLQQVVWNLLSNAVKFTPQGGKIEIRLEQVGNESVDEWEGRSVNALPSRHPPIRSYAQIQVRDTGKGITPEFIPHVFEYFRQEDGTTTRRFGGLGLGLAIVRYLTELHGGTVKVESSGEGQGTTFTVRLPLRGRGNGEAGERGEISHPLTPASHSPLRGLRILVVDDEADMRELISTILEQAGAEIKVTTSAIEALDALNSFKPDLLISDIGMPEMDGYELLHQIRQLPLEQKGRIPAIALTAYAGEINQQQALAAGFQQHLAKPVAPEVLVKAIDTLMKSQRE